MDDMSQQPLYQTLHSINFRVSPQGFTISPSFSHVTLNYLQPQPSDSIFSDSLTYVQDGKKAGSFSDYQNNSLNNNNNKGIKGVFPSYEMRMSAPYLNASNNNLDMFQYSNLSPQSQSVLNSQQKIISPSSYPTLGSIDTTFITTTPFIVEESQIPPPQHLPPSEVQLEAAKFATPSPPKHTNSPTLQDISKLNNCRDDTGVSQSCEPEEIDTQYLVKKISDELNRLSILQITFAKRVLRRSHTTLSGLLRHPKPWAKLKKNGRENYRKMWKWLQEPECQKMSLRFADESIDGGAHPKGFMESQLPCSVASQILQRGKLKEEPQNQPGDMLTRKKSRVVFTVLQRRTLWDIFKETRKPTKKMQCVIASRMGLKTTSVNNFFKNARKQSKRWEDKGLTELTSSADLSLVTQQHGLDVLTCKPPSPTLCDSKEKYSSERSLFK